LICLGIGGEIEALLVDFVVEELQHDFGNVLESVVLADEGFGEDDSLLHAAHIDFLVADVDDYG
jgi:hypothetical protein